MGDEMRRTQGGNNNPYCQDNEISWLDWSLLERHRDVHRFVKRHIELRLRSDLADEPGMTLAEVLRRSKVRWHGVDLDAPDWSDASRALALTVTGLRGRYDFHIIANAYWEALDFELPEPRAGLRGGWRVLIDTSKESPFDVSPKGESPSFEGERYPAGPRSVVMLYARR
jgi:glycogen operon protein